MISLLPPEMHGVMFVTGSRGVGKSWLMSQLDNPKNVLFLDCEDKGEGIDSQLGFGKYISLTQKATEYGGGPLALYKAFAETIEKIEKDQFIVCIIDNVSPLELALRAEAGRDVKKYVQEFGLNLDNVLNGRFGGLSSVVNFLISEKICAPLHSKGVKLIAVSAHIKPKWVPGGMVIGKNNIKGAERWQELSILTLILVTGENRPVPSAIVQKEQLGSITFDEATGEFTTIRRLPLRMPKCTMKELKRYLKEPANLVNPAKGEEIVNSEYDPYVEELSREQVALWQMGAEYEKQQMVQALQIEKEEKALLDTVVVSDAKRLKAEGKSFPEIAKELGVSIPVVMGMLK